MEYSKYEVPYNPKPLRARRKLRVVCIGGGLGGMTLAYKIQHEMKLEDVIDFTIYERQSKMGGTWVANRYPGLTCDVPVHVYTLPFCPKHDWSHFMAGGPEIQQYAGDVVRKFDLDKHVQLETSVLKAAWNETTGKWELEIKRKDGTVVQDQCDVLIGACGTQNTPSEPKIPGLKSFEGPIVHTGNWDENLDWKGKKVAVIGNGSSGIQVFGAMQKDASAITHYIRSPTWISLIFASQFTPDGKNFAYTPEQKQNFLSNPQELFAYRQKLESAGNGIFKNLVFDETCPEIKANFRKQMEEVMRFRLKDSPYLIKSLIPTYQPWCRRLTPGDEYLEALQAGNASLIDQPIVEVTEGGIRTHGEGGEEEREVDVIVTATGFVNSRVPPWAMKGRGGRKLEEVFGDHADGYMSVAAPEMPNYFTVGCGPNFVIANGSIMSAYGFITDYVLKWIEKIATEDIKSVCVKSDAVEAFNIYIQQILRRTAWNRDCDSWYKKGKADEYRTGITAIYPGSMMHFKAMLETIRAEDFDFEYRSRNKFSFYGCGLTELDLTDGADLAGHLKGTMKLENMI